MAKGNFCTMGAVPGRMNMGHPGRLRCWMFAVAVAPGGLLLLELAAAVTLPGSTAPPYLNTAVRLAALPGRRAAVRHRHDIRRAAAMFAAARPSRVGVQSFAFISPIGDTGRDRPEPARLSLLTCGVVAVFGLVVGPFLHALASRSFRIDRFVSWSDFANRPACGLPMGVGGFVAMGCTIG